MQGKQHRQIKHRMDRSYILADRLYINIISQSQKCNKSKSIEPYLLLPAELYIASNAQPVDLFIYIWLASKQCKARLAARTVNKRKLHLDRLIIRR